MSIYTNFQRVPRWVEIHPVIAALKKSYENRLNDFRNKLEKEYREESLAFCASIGPHDWGGWENRPWDNGWRIHDHYRRTCKRCGAEEEVDEKPEGEIKELPVGRFP